MNTIKREKITEQAITDKTGIPQSTVHRLIYGKNKKLDLPKIRAIQNALGIISEPEQSYGVTAIHRKITPEEEALLQKLNDQPELKEGLEEMMKLSPRQLKKHVGLMIADIDGEK